MARLFPMASIALIALSASAQTSAPRSEPVKLPLGTYPKLVGVYESIHAPARTRTLSPGEKDNRETLIHDNLVDITVDVVVNENGRVESAHATGGPAEFYTQAEAIELRRTFEPFRIKGTIARVRFDDGVRVLPPEEWAAEHTPWPTNADLATASIALQRTACFGSCPAYTVTIAGNGLVNWYSEGNPAIRGSHTAHISVDAVRNLIDQFRQSDFLSAKDEYRCGWTDMPTQTFTLKLNGKVKSVVDYGGPIVGLPDAIERLESKVDDAAGVSRWISWTPETLPALLAEKWNFGSASKDNIALYNSAIGAHQAPVIALFEAAKAPILSADPHEPAPICAASASGDHDLVLRMFASWPKTAPLPSTLPNECLICAALGGNVATVDFWLAHGAQPAPAVSPRDYRRQPLPTAVIAAIWSHHPDVLERILQLKPPLDATANDGESALVYALERGASEDPSVQPRLLKLLLQAGANPNTPDRNGNPPLFDAGWTPAAVSILVDAGAKIDATAPNGDTALMRSAFVEQAVRALLAAGADPTLKNKEGKTAVEIAKQFQCPACVTLLEEAVKTHLDSATPRP